MLWIWPVHLNIIFSISSEFSPKWDVFLSGSDSKYNKEGDFWKHKKIEIAEVLSLTDGKMLKFCLQQQPELDT